MRSNVAFMVLAFLGILFSPPLLAEDENAIVQQSMTDPAEAAKWNAKIMEGKGRDDKAQDAEGRGNAGQAAATAAGIALMAAGVPMLASILPPVRAAGARLVAKAAQEFAQAAAMRAASGDNKGQKDLLRQSYAPGETKNLSMKMPADFEQLANSKGVNAQELWDKIQDGSMQDPNFLLSSLGESTDLSDEDKAEADRLTDQAFGKVVSEVTEQMAISMKDSELKDGKSQDTGAAKLTTAPPGGAGDSGAQGADRGLASVLSTENGGAIAGEKAMSDAESGKASSSYINELLTRFGMAGDDEKQKIFLLDAALEKLGIYRPRKGQHIFEKARKNYSLFNRWRSQSKVGTKG